MEVSYFTTGPVRDSPKQILDMSQEKKHTKFSNPKDDIKDVSLYILIRTNSMVKANTNGSWTRGIERVPEFRRSYLHTYK